MKQKKLKYLLFVNLFSLAGFYIFAPLYAIFAHGFGVTPKSISFIWSGYSLAMAFFILLMGRVENRMNKGKMAVIGYFTYALGALSFLLVHTERSLILVLIFNALGAGITLPAYMTLFAKNEVKGKESQQWSWLSAGDMVATSIGAAFGGVVVGAFGFRGVFIAMASVQCVAAVVAYQVLCNE